MMNTIINNEVTNDCRNNILSPASTLIHKIKANMNHVITMHKLSKVPGL